MTTTIPSSHITEPGTSQRSDRNPRKIIHQARETVTKRQDALHPLLPNIPPMGIFGSVVSEVVCPGRCPAPAFTAVQPQQPLILLPGMETDMCGIEDRIELPLASSAAGCSCCSTDSSSSSARSGTGAVVFSVEGLTCGHCVQTVEKAVSALDGVESASVDLVPGGRSRLVVGGTADNAAVREAVTSAGDAFTSN